MAEPWLSSCTRTRVGVLMTAASRRFMAGHVGLALQLSSPAGEYGERKLRAASSQQRGAPDRACAGHRASGRIGGSNHYVKYSLREASF